MGYVCKENEFYFVYTETIYKIFKNKASFDESINP